MPEPITMRAYPDSKCSWGYMTVCDNCKQKAPSYVELDKPIENPPAKGKKQHCELCGKYYVLT